MASAAIPEWSPPEVPLPCERELLDEARRICRQRLAVDRARPRELNLLGLLAGRASSYDLAVGCLKRAVELEPRNAVYLADLATALSHVGAHEEAVGASLRALVCDPSSPEHLAVLARTLHGHDLLREAAAVFESYLVSEPGDASAIAELADVRKAQGRTADAIAGYQAALQFERSSRNRAGLYARIAEVYVSCEQWDAVLATCREGLDLDESLAALHYAEGQALMGLGRFEQAVNAFRDTLNGDPTHYDATRQLVFALELLGRRGDASRAWLHLGITLDAREAFAEATVAYRQALARKEDCLDALLRLGRAELQLGRPAEAIGPLRAALAIEPTHLTAHFHLGCALQLTGHWHDGWDEFAWLSDPRRIKAWRAFEQPRWDGSSLSGKRILFWAGQDYGLGDTLHLVRFARHLKRLGAIVIVECQPRLAAIVRRMSDVDYAAPRGGSLRAFDVHAPMMWVPAIDRSARELVASDVPYLYANPDLVVKWQARLKPTTAKRVGLSWGGKADRRDVHRRSLSLALLSPLASVLNVQFVSLQMGPQADDVLVGQPGMDIEVLQHDGHSLDDTAALLANLDLVITVDTMIAHLAGGMGRPVWTMLPFAAEWRWLDGGATPWYPSMRLFRQPAQGDWSVVIEQVRQALVQWAS